MRIDPRDARHLYLGVSSGGVFESTDAGADWRPLNAGCAADFMPDPDPEYGHDPHCVEVHPRCPTACISRTTAASIVSTGRVNAGRASATRCRRRIGDIGFPIVLHPTDPDKAWVFPMDGTTVWPRTSVDGKPAVYARPMAASRGAGSIAGLPRKQGWFTVLRQAMCADDEVKKLGLYFGTTSGEIWASRNEGSSWTCLARHLPQVFSVTWGNG